MEALWGCLAAPRRTHSGLSSREAAQRLESIGPNELRETAPISPWTIFLGQFKSLIIWILIVAGVVSGTLGEVVDAIARRHGYDAGPGCGRAQ